MQDEVTAALMNALGGSWSSESMVGVLAEDGPERLSAARDATPAGATPLDFADITQALAYMTQQRPVRRRSVVQLCSTQAKHVESAVS